MADFAGTVGNGSGSFFCLSAVQEAGTLYSAQYKAQLDEISNSGLTDADKSAAISQGVYENIPDNLQQFYRMIQENVRQTVATPYVFDKGFYTNTTLTQLQVLAIMYSGNIVTDLLSHPDTLKLDSVNINNLALLNKLT